MEWLELYSRQISLVVVAILVVAGGWWFYKKSHERRAQNASVALSDASQAIDAGNLPLAQSNLEKISSRYDNTPSGRQARLLLGQVLYEKGEYQQGIAQLQKLADEKDKLTQSAAYNLIGAGYEQQKKFVEAADAYRKAAAATTYSGYRDNYMANAARALTNAGKNTEAREIWSKLAADPNSPAASEAKVRLGELEAKAAKQG